MTQCDIGELSHFGTLCDTMTLSHFMTPTPLLTPASPGGHSALRLVTISCRVVLEMLWNLPNISRSKLRNSS